VRITDPHRGPVANRGDHVEICDDLGRRPALRPCV